MKKILFILFAFVSLSTFAQRDLGPKPLPANKPIELVKGKFFIDGEQYSSYDIKNHFMYNNLDAYAYYKKNKTKSTLGGLCLGLGSALIVGDAVKALVSDEDYPGSFTYVGVGLVAVSIPILSGRKAALNKSIELYNASLSQEKTLGFNYEVDFVTNQNGVGLRITF